MSIFKVDKNYTVILNPDAVRLVPELAGLTQSELVYIILVMDYHDSPFRKKPYEERRSLAIKKVFGDKEVNLETTRIHNAMEAYKSLVFDIRLETLDVLKRKAQVYHKELLIPDIDFKRMKELDQGIQYLEERIDKIENSMLAEDMDNVELKGQKKLSYLEIWQRRQIEFRKFKEKL